MAKKNMYNAKAIGEAVAEAIESLDDLSSGNMENLNLSGYANRYSEDGPVGSFIIKCEAKISVTRIVE